LYSVGRIEQHHDKDDHNLVKDVLVIGQQQYCSVDETGGFDQNDLDEKGAAVNCKLFVKILVGHYFVNFSFEKKVGEGYQCNQKYGDVPERQTKFFVIAEIPAKFVGKEKGECKKYNAPDKQ